MTSLKWVMVFVICLSFIVFVTFFGRLPALRRTPVAALHRLIWIRLPSALYALDTKLSSGRLSRWLLRFGNCMMHDRHPTVVVFFLAILMAAQYLYLPEAWPLIGWVTKLCVAAVVFMPYLFLCLACSSDPGYITHDNHAHHMSLYPYDYAVFHPGNVCRTCRLLKPARSKHCSICKRCIARADHHCAFINSCVGYGNHHWFLLLLFSTAVLTTYGGLLGLSILSSTMKDHYPDWSLWKPANMTVNSYLAVWAWAIQRNVRLGATTLLASLTTPLVWGLLLYTLYQVYAGTTTNESLKWSVFKEDMHDGYAFRRVLPSSRQRDWRTEPLCRRWPVEPAHILVATSDGNPPADDARLPGQGPWERVRKLKHIENLYDMGFWDNLLDSFIQSYVFGSRADDPPSERKRRLT
ncbi:DHHC zinc finger domain-containing protein [Ophiocordyceps sinensis CO18]|uniref:Palmitoyltransferase n=1 Tax=Ophiocordyceps sinensis (strain Co18 / CGMCC 3.14243) TaxID=911162 RepID=T5A6W0_OPHSC|nr:DHHC zinc finger domain-containing protein [Ophiocordyceps sinensis CO18]